jgi:hypothetical protein
MKAQNKVSIAPHVFRALAILPLVGVLTACRNNPAPSAYQQSLTDEGRQQLCANLSDAGCRQKMRQVQAAKLQEVSAQAEKDRLRKLPRANRDTPESQYAHLDSGYQLAALFYALSAMPPDYDVLAAAASREYRTTTDEFRKRDLLQALRGKIDQDLARYKDPRNRYFTLDQNNAAVQHYDFKTSSFPVGYNIGPGAYTYFNDAPNYKLAYNNGGDFLRMPVADEQRAKEIESMVTRYQLAGGVSTFYIFVQEADTTNNEVKAHIVRVVMKDQKHSEIARF